MASPRKIPTELEPRGDARPLHEILSALTAEFVKAAAGRDLGEVHWRQVYREHAALSGFEPSRVRIVGATVALPVAIHQIGAPAAETAEARPLAPAETETRFLYRTADLEKLRPELILRLDLTLGID